jgi:hypothetical protein
VKPAWECVSMKIFLLGQACNFLDEIYGGWQVGI